MRWPYYRGGGKAGFHCIVNFFQIWSMQAGYEELAMGNTEPMLKETHSKVVCLINYVYLHCQHPIRLEYQSSTLWKKFTNQPWQWDQ